ncbi:hypothetical protein BX600DRAFT_505470 [Xylariales sp. PMI_506]|nr:hypothetical protein BX600DRAFT_505470 [Xylariales sp. PMI_506]
MVIPLIPPWQARNNAVSDIDLSIRFKYGIHSIFLFVSPTSTFSAISAELLDVLRDRYPDGLQPDKESPPIPLPDEASLIDFAVPKAPTDPTQGWKPLRAGPDDTAVAKGLKDNQIVAFAFRGEDVDALAEADFEVVFPTYDEEEEMEE